jgi:RNA polymerase sigma-70 factor (ECF subfamily)
LAIRDNAPGWQRRVFEHFHELVYRLLIKALGPNAEIEDLVGDVFLKLFENARNIRTQGALRSYVVSVAMNAARRELYRRKRRAIFHKIAGTPHEIEQRPGHDDPKAKAALLQLSRILDELSVGARLAFLLHSLEGMTLPEIALTLRISHSTAKRRVRRANAHVLKRVGRNALLADYVRERTGG